MNRNLVLLFSALIGLCIDIFNHTLGLNMLPCVVVGFLRFYILQLLTLNSLPRNYRPSSVTFGKFRFFYYSFLITMLHQVVLFTVESVYSFDFVSFIFHIGGSVTITMILIFAFDKLSVTSK